MITLIDRATPTGAGSDTTQWHWSMLVGTLLLAICMRLPTFLGVPIFYDESVYLQRALVFPNAIGTTLTDGKLIQELVLALLVRLPGDPLLWGRALSLLAGLGVIATLWGLGRMLSQSMAGILAGLLYTVAPLAELHDGLALPDTLLTLAGCWVLVASLRLALLEHPRRRDAALAGGIVGVATLVKLPGLFLLSVPMLAVLIMKETTERRERLGYLRLVFIAALLFPALVAPFHYGGSESSKLGGDWLATRISNSMLVIDWLWRYLPFGLVLLPLTVLLIGYRRRTHTWRSIAWLLTSASVFVVIFIVIGNRLAPRYLLPAWPPFLLSIGIAANELWKLKSRWQYGLRWLVGFVMSAAFAWGVTFAGLMAYDPTSTPLAAADRWQYVESWTAGYPAAELLSTLRSQAKVHGAITVVTDDQPRLVGNVARIYLLYDPRVHLALVALPEQSAIPQIANFAATRPTYLLVDQQQRDAYQIGTRFPGARVVADLKNPNSDMRFYVYEIVP